MLAPTKRRIIMSQVSEWQTLFPDLSVTDCLNQMVIDKAITLNEADYIINWLF